MASRTHFDPPSGLPFPGTHLRSLKTQVSAPTGFRSGDPVPAPGTYWVLHSKHRPAHASKVRFPIFPSCAQCGDQVRFHPAEETTAGLIGEWLRRDPDFQKTLARTRLRRRKKSE